MMIYPDLANKTVVVTGANRGIGKSIAEHFIKNKCKVVLICRKQAPKIDVKSDLTKPIFVKADINDIIKISKWLEDFEKKRQHVDILVNNAGIFMEKALLDVQESDWDLIMNTNIKSTFFLSQLFAKHMIDDGGGVIINAASFAVKIPSTFSGIYSASKAAIVNLTKCMAAEWAPYNIRVNAFSPGVIETQMTKPARNKNRERMLDQISLNRFGKPDEVAKVVLFLASDSASYITGTNLDISGGKLIVQNPADAR